MSNQAEHGLFLAVEGMDGSGKSTVISHIATVLRELGRPVVTTREVGGTPIGMAIRSICYSKQEEQLDPMSMVLLNYAARIQHIRNVIAPNILSGKDVVTDRYNFSTRVYQGVLGKSAPDMDVLESTPPLRMLATIPDYTFYLRISADTSYARVKGRGAADNDRYKNDIEVTRKVHAAYESVMLDYSNKHANRIIYIDAERDLEEVKEQIALILKSLVLVPRE